MKAAIKETPEDRSKGMNKARQVAWELADRYANSDATAFSDWMDISEYERGDLGIHYCVQNAEEFEAMNENEHLFKRALRALVNNDDAEAGRTLRAVFANYEPVEKYWETVREEYLLENSWVGKPDYDRILDAQRG